MQALFPWFCLCFQRAFKTFDDVWRLWEVSAPLRTLGMLRTLGTGPHTKWPVFFVFPSFLALDVAQWLKIFSPWQPCPYSSILLFRSSCSLSPAPSQWAFSASMVLIALGDSLSPVSSGHSQSLGLGHQP